MDNVLEELWYSYLAECPADISNEEKNFLLQLIQKEEQLQKSLTVEQKEIFKNYQAAYDKLYDLYEKDAFIKGIQFATKFFIEATT